MKPPKFTDGFRAVPEIDERARRWMENYYPGPNCRTDRCLHYRGKDSDSRPWCWLMNGIGAEGREAECPAYIRRRVGGRTE